jgi:hypothetical protein
MILFPCVFADYPVHFGRENTDSVDADMGLQFTDASKIHFKKTRQVGRSCANLGGGRRKK